jgi:TatD DNase family protein
MRGQRNEPAFVAYVLQKLAETYGVDEETVSAVTTANVARIFPSIVNKS